MKPAPQAADPITTPEHPSPADATALFDALLCAVEAKPSAFDFFALMRRVETLRRELPRLGEALRPRQEALRLAQSADLDFASAALQRLQRRGELPPRLVVRFFGLLGPQGPMPLHFTEYVRDREHHHGDTTLAHFLDLFHHRLLSLFYRAWAQSQPVVHHDRPEQDRFRAWLAALAGAPHDAGLLAPSVLAFHAHWLAGRSRHPESLQKVLQQHFGVRARVEEHVGHWLPIERDDRSQLGHARNRGERSAGMRAQLGVSANAGTRVWDRQYRFRLHLGPLTADQYASFLPGGTAWQTLLQWVRLLAGPEMQWDLRLTLAASSRPPARLDGGTRLGVATWLGQPRNRAQDRSPDGPLHRPQRPPRSLTLRPLSCFLNRRPGALHV